MPATRLFASPPQSQSTALLSAEAEQKWKPIVPVSCAVRHRVEAVPIDALRAMKRFSTDGNESPFEFPRRPATKWPSKSSILETPERRRYRQSVSFGDSGLGSSLFGSPPSEQGAVTATTSPLLRTPTDRAARSGSGLRTNSTPSPLRSFVHISSYGGSFGSPEVRSSPSFSKELRMSLSNPDKATGYRFSGELLNKHWDVLTKAAVEGGQSLAAISQHAVPSTSRATNRCLEMPPASQLHEEARDEAVADVTIPYGEPETPSKCFGRDMSLERNLFCVEDFDAMTTSTPMREDRLCFGQMHSEVDMFSVADRAGESMETNLCDLSGACSSSSSVDFAYPCSSYTAYSTSAAPSPMDYLADRSSVHSAAGFHDSMGTASPFGQPMESSAPFSSEFRPPEALREDDSVNLRVLSATSRNRNPPMCSNPFKPFKPPSKPLKAFSRRWTQITCGETTHQVDVTKGAHRFLASLRSNAEDSQQ